MKHRLLVFAVILSLLLTACGGIQRPVRKLTSR